MIARRARLTSADLALGLGTLLVLWSLGAKALDRDVLPSPAVALAAFGRALERGLLPDVGISLWRVVGGLGLALFTAVPLGLWLGRQDLGFAARRPGPAARGLARIVTPLVYLIYPIPKVVFLPVVMVLFGIGDWSKIFLIALIVFFQILVTTRDAVRGLSRQALLSFASLGGSERQLVGHVLLPAALPGIFTALRISLGTSIAVLFFSETFATRRGIGYYVIDMWSRIAYPEMFAGVLAMALMGLALYAALDLAEARLCRWVRL